MYFLGTDYIVSSLLWLLAIFAFVFTFRKQIAKLFYPKTTLDLFISKLKGYLEKTYPDIKFDYSIVAQSKSEKNPELRKSIIATNLINQYKKVPFGSSKYPTSTPSSLHNWSSYVFHCEPNKDKLPGDWGQRKNAILTRDKAKCLRCSKHLTINTVVAHMIKPLENGGKYHLENLVSICKDCEILITNNQKKLSSLDIIHDINEIDEKS